MISSNPNRPDRFQWPSVRFARDRNDLRRKKSWPIGRSRADPILPTGPCASSQQISRAAGRRRHGSRRGRPLRPHERRGRPRSHHRNAQPCRRPRRSPDEEDRRHAVGLSRPHDRSQERTSVPLHSDFQEPRRVRRRHAGAQPLAAHRPADRPDQRAGGARRTAALTISRKNAASTAIFSGRTSRTEIASSPKIRSSSASRPSRRAFRSKCGFFPNATQATSKRARKSQFEFLAPILSESLRRMDKALARPSYNFILHSSPLHEKTGDYYHWHIEDYPEADPSSRLRMGHRVLHQPGVTGRVGEVSSGGDDVGAGPLSSLKIPRSAQPLRHIEQIVRAAGGRIMAGRRLPPRPRAWSATARAGPRNCPGCRRGSSMRCSPHTSPCSSSGKPSGVQAARPADRYFHSLPHAHRQRVRPGPLRQPDPDMEIDEALARRDFTMNAMAWDPDTMELRDPFNGRADLDAHVLRHASDRFGEDPTRVLRGMQLAARFGLTAAPETVALCATLSQDGQPRERLWEEWKKLLLHGRQAVTGSAVLERLRLAPLLPGTRGAPRLPARSHLAPGRRRLDPHTPLLGLVRCGTHRR